MKTPPFALIQTFLVFAEAPNMQEAGKILGLSQPAVTSHLMQFQDYFPHDVFAMEGRKKTLTPFGLELKLRLKARFNNLQHDLMELDQKFSRPEDRKLIIAGLAEILGHLAKKLSFSGTLVFQQTDSVKAIEGLLHRQFDIALTTQLAKAAQLHARTFFSDSFCLIIPKQWKYDGVSLSKNSLMNLIQEPYLSYKEDDGNLEKILGSFKIDRGPKFSKVISDWRRLSEMVSESQGWTICPDSFVDSERQVVLRISSSLIPQTIYYLIYRKEFVKTDWSKTLLAQIKNIKRCNY